MGLGYRRDQPWDEKVGLLSSTQPPGRGMGPEAALPANSQGLNRAGKVHTTPEAGSEGVWVGAHMEVLGGQSTQSTQKPLCLPRARLPLLL